MFSDNITINIERALNISFFKRDKVTKRISATFCQTKKSSAYKNIYVTHASYKHTKFIAKMCVPN